MATFGAILGEIGLLFFQHLVTLGACFFIRVKMAARRRQRVHLSFCSLIMTRQIGSNGDDPLESSGGGDAFAKASSLGALGDRTYTVAVVDVIKLFWRKSGKSRFPLKPKQQE